MGEGPTRSPYQYLVFALFARGISTRSDAGLDVALVPDGVLDAGPGGSDGSAPEVPETA